MKTAIITALVAVSVAFTAYASLPPNSGSLDWEEIEMNLRPSSQNERRDCQSSRAGLVEPSHSALRPLS
ncbi:hypothetical protein [Rhizobium sp. WL3]|uniref:hypothetical protein n=1 Tax=Rhizobium sp. WL3 TaxID=2603277 RepID=UPI00164FD2DA|nr:hypothetical protein [Rhizobium sp. WL3]